MVRPRNNVDDVEFTRAVVNDVQKRFPIIRKNIFATGFSNGAMFCYQLARMAPGLVAAIGPVSGDMGIMTPPPHNPMPVIHFHGILDQNCPFNGGYGAHSIDHCFHTPIPEVIGAWTTVNKCGPTQVTTGTDYECGTYPGTHPVVLYKLPGGGHQWPGGIAVDGGKGGPLVADVPAALWIWEFFKQFV